MWHGPLIPLTWFIDMCDTTHRHVTWPIVRANRISNRKQKQSSLSGMFCRKSFIPNHFNRNRNRNKFVPVTFEFLTICDIYEPNLFCFATKLKSNQSVWPRSQIENFVTVANVTHWVWLVQNLFLFLFGMRIGTALMFDMTHWHVRHDSFICATWRLHGRGSEWALLPAVSEYCYVSCLVKCVCVCVLQSLQHTHTHCNKLQHTATHCNTLHTLWWIFQPCTRGTATHCATHCNTMQHTARHTATHCAPSD